MLLLVRLLAQSVIIIGIAILALMLFISALPTGPQRIITGLLSLLIVFTLFSIGLVVGAVNMREGGWKSLRQTGWQEPLNARILMLLWWISVLILFTWGMIIGLIVILLH